jgi:cellulose biosynthesis protein BcsQ
MELRIDVFSLKGGAGKTTIAFQLAKLEAQDRPVLLIDADLTGTCLGALLQPEVRWSAQEELAGLICGRPELLEERLMPEELPVYEWLPLATASRPLTQVAADGARRVSGSSSGKGFFFCPSHVAADAVEHPEILHALQAHESAGEWIDHVLTRLVEAAEKILGTPFGSVLVDHGPGMGPLQLAALRKTLATNEQRKALIVTTRDLVDLEASQEFGERLRARSPNLFWVINRTKTATWLPGDDAPVSGGRRVVAALDTLLRTWITEVDPVRIPEDASWNDGYALSRIAGAGTLAGVSELCGRLRGPTP